MTEGLEDFEKWLEYQVELNTDEKMLDTLWDIELKVVQELVEDAYGRCWSTKGKLGFIPITLKISH